MFCVTGTEGATVYLRTLLLEYKRLGRGAKITQVEEEVTRAQDDNFLAEVITALLQ
jgi:hypothetical protein